MSDTRATFRRGFTLVELMAVIAILALFVAVVVPRFATVNEAAEERAAVQQLMAQIQRARAAASAQPAAATPRVRSAGITVVGPTRYARFTDTDANAGGETTQTTVDLSTTGLTITAPAPTSQIRFRPDGTRLPGSPATVTLTGAGGRTYQITLSIAGLAELQ